MSHRKVAFFRLVFWYCPFGKRHSSSTVRESECERASVRECGRAKRPKTFKLKTLDSPLQQAGSATMTFGAAKLLSLKLCSLLQCNKTPPICYKTP